MGSGGQQSGLPSKDHAQSRVSSSSREKHNQVQVSFSTKTRRENLEQSNAIYSFCRWCVGLVQASTFSMVYFVAPFYMLSCLVCLVYFKFYQAPLWVWCYTSPLCISMILPPMAMPGIISILKPMLDYFELYEQIQEVSSEELRKTGKNYILACQPHGVISFTGILSAVAASEEYRGKIPTAVADALLYTPILKHVMGIFGLISASKKSLYRHLKKEGVHGTVVLYVGGMAELFLSCPTEERLYLKQRKGFIKLSLQTGVDIIPVYLFGNTTVLSIMKHGILSQLSRKLQVSLTYMWGKWYLPVPRNDVKLLYVSGHPVGIPHVPNPTQTDIDKYHELYCQQVQRLYRDYRERVPEYKHKDLHIM